MQQTPPHSQAYLIIQLGSRWTDILQLQTGQTVTIGRSSENQIVVRDERVSRKHAEISHQNGGWQIIDLGSRNGTHVSGQLVTKAHSLASGQNIVIGGCQIVFSNRLADAFPGIKESSDGKPESERAEGADQPTIVSRLSRSYWSAEIDPNDCLAPSDSIPGSGDNSVGIGAPTASASSDENTWSFFYRLVYELASSTTAEQAAGVALDRLLTELGIASGGIVQFDFDQFKSSETADKQKSSRESEIHTAVLAIRQAPGRSYHRISDYLARVVVLERQAVLARNIQDQEQTSFASQSAQQNTTSVLCAPLRSISGYQPETILGLLHIYTQIGERMLTPDDLHLVVGVADNLAIALANLQVNQRLTTDLDASRQKVKLLEERLDQTSELVGRSTAMQGVRNAISRVAATEATVLIRGESGVGKELVARAIHAASKRSDGPLVCLNCAALAPTLLESELFGHEKGAFTGATERKIGKFEAAHRGTLLLDEIGEMPLELQAKFLRVLEGHPFERLGGNTPIHTNIRVISATNRDLEEAVRAKEFRSDLYFRLRVIEIPVPPLRARPDDIPELVEHFLETLRPHAHRRLLGVEPAAMGVLVRHRWPGNVRELRNTLERAVVLGVKSTIGVEDLSLASIPLDAPEAEPNVDYSFEPIPLADLEKKHIMAVLEYVQGNKSKAAGLLGIERSTLDRKLKRL